MYWHIIREVVNFSRNGLLTNIILEVMSINYLLSVNKTIYEHTSISISIKSSLELNTYLIASFFYTRVLLKSHTVGCCCYWKFADLVGMSNLRNSNVFAVHWWCLAQTDLHKKLLMMHQMSISSILEHHLEKYKIKLIWYLWNELEKLG